MIDYGQTEDTTTEMASITITLTATQIQQSKALAERWGTRLEDLVQMKVEELLIPPDAEAKRLTEYIMTKNAELYKRLA